MPTSNLTSKTIGFIGRNKAPLLVLTAALIAFVSVIAWFVGIDVVLDLAMSLGIGILLFLIAGSLLRVLENELERL